MEAIIVHNIRLVEAANVIGEWMRLVTVEEDNETNMTKRISSRSIFENPRNATRDEALTVLNAKEDKREAACYRYRNTVRNSRWYGVKNYKP